MNQLKPVPLSIYAGEVANFFARIENKLSTGSGIPMNDRQRIVWKHIEEQRRDTPFPAVRTEGRRLDERERAANRLIVVLNETEDVNVFKIATNALLLIIRGQTGYVPYFEGSPYDPDNLEQALAEVEETRLAA